MNREKRRWTMKNKRQSKYSQLSNLQDIASEKARLKRLIKAQGSAVEADWDEVYSFWSFVPKVARTVTSVVRQAPRVFNAVSFVFDLIGRKRR